jgi:hypothetical protein
MSLIKEWLVRPSWVSVLGMVGGLLLYVSGAVWKRQRDRALGITVFFLSIFAGLLLYFYG